MAKNRSVTADQLREGTFVQARGTLSYSRLFEPIAGEALERYNAGRRFKAAGPLTTATITHAQVVPMSNPPGPEDIYLNESVFTSDKHPEYGNQITLDNKSPINPLPTFLQRQADGSVAGFAPTGDLAAGVNVTLVGKVYKPKNNDNRGISLEVVIVEDLGEIKYYSGGMGVTESDLSALGLTLSAPMVARELPAATNAPAAANDNPWAAAASGMAAPGSAAPEFAQPQAPAQAAAQAAAQAPAAAFAPPAGAPAAAATPAAQAQTAPATAPAFAAPAAAPASAVAAADPAQAGSAFAAPAGAPTAAPAAGGAVAAAPQGAPAAETPTGTNPWGGADAVYTQPQW